MSQPIIPLICNNFLQLPYWAKERFDKSNFFQKTSLIALLSLQTGIHYAFLKGDTASRILTGKNIAYGTVPVACILTIYRIAKKVLPKSQANSSQPSPKLSKTLLESTVGEVLPYIKARMIRAICNIYKFYLAETIVCVGSAACLFAANYYCNTPSKKIAQVALRCLFAPLALVIPSAFFLSGDAQQKCTLIKLASNLPLTQHSIAGAAINVFKQIPYTYYIAFEASMLVGVTARLIKHSNISSSVDNIAFQSILVGTVAWHALSSFKTYVGQTNANHFSLLTGLGTAGVLTYLKSSTKININTYLATTGLIAGGFLLSHYLYRAQSKYLTKK